MRWKLLARTLWNHHRAACVTGLAALIALGALPFALGDGDGCAPRRGNSRLLLDRVWFDQYPEDERDELSIWIFLSSGVGLYQHGSQYRASYEIFELVRNGHDLEVTFLQDGEEARTRFEITRCDDVPPFDLCLTLDDPARGPRRYFAFSDESALAERLPWATRLRGSLSDAGGGRRSP